MSLLNEGELADAIELQSRAYRLLTWLAEAIPKGAVRFERAHTYLSSADAAAAWIGDHQANFPPDARPRSLNPIEQRAFANLFASYLETSFEMVAHPGVGLRPDNGGCMCSMCATLVQLPHLRTRKLTKRDTSRARDLKLDRLGRIARAVERDLSPDERQALIDDDELGPAVTASTYGEHLLLRMHGLSDGPAVLVLWRQMAWKPEGSPKRDFKLRAPDVIAGELRLVERISGLT
jgi:hypothetical protein